MKDETELGFYHIWKSMRQRCLNPNCHAFHNYGGRGITIDPHWDDYKKFKEDMYDSFLEHIEKYGGGRNTTIDRKDVNGNYCKENCKWATYFEQANNKRDTRRYPYNGSFYTAPELLLYFPHTPGLTRDIVKLRIDRSGYTVDRALNEPIKPIFSDNNSIYYKNILYTIRDFYNQFVDKSVSLHNFTRRIQDNRYGYIYKGEVIDNRLMGNSNDYYKKGRRCPFVFKDNYSYIENQKIT